MVREGPRTDGDVTGSVAADPSTLFVEARRHVRAGDLRAAARALAQVGAAAPRSAAAHRAEAARQLCLAGVEHERHAASLEQELAGQQAAARRSRAQVEVLLGDAEAGDVVPSGPDASPPPGTSRPIRGAGASPPAPGREDGAEGRLVARLLGNFEVEWQGRAVSDWGSLRGRTVLQYLLIDPSRPVRRDVFMELLWPGYSHESARNNLNVAIYSLRRSLCRNAAGPAVVVHRDGCYLLNPDLDVVTDRETFLAELASGALALAERDLAGGTAALERAVALYRGALYDDDPAGEWFLPERRLLEERALEAHERLAALRIERGEPGVALRSAQAALRLDPCRESAHRLVMQAYASLQQTQSVARQYRLCVQALASQLGLGPAPETTQLYRQLANVG